MHMLQDRSLFSHLLILVSYQVLYGTRYLVPGTVGPSLEDVGPPPYLGPTTVYQLLVRTMGPTRIYLVLGGT